MPAPILTLDQISLGFGQHALFKNLDLVLHQGDRVCLVGRNGAGKSSLLKVIAGLLDADGGERVLQAGTQVGYLEQEPDFSGFATLGDYAAAALDPADHYRAEIALEGLDIAMAMPAQTASGGERRRAALARLLAAEPDIMLLDEPTNHLDINAIEWLENHLLATKTAYVLISHDRQFLTKLSRSTIWLDRGEARRLPQGFAAFESWRDQTLEAEREQRHKLNRLIKAEARWAVEGITARRKRNMGRVRRLAELREERRNQIAETGRAAMSLAAGQLSGKLVVEADNLAKSFGDRRIVAPFSARIHRGDRIALVGPNGAGKTTLLRLLTGDLAPDAGKLTLGANLEIAKLDQNRAALDPQKTLWETLTEDKLSRVSGHSDQVMVRGRPQHVVGYLKQFLFDEGQARSPVQSLSGGERARLLLAKLMTRSANFLVLDEPTNDLDIETLDLLQELLGDFDGTVLLVSHDRDFIDRVATLVIAPFGDGGWRMYAGGWSDYLLQRPVDDVMARAQTKTAPVSKKPAEPRGVSKPVQNPAGKPRILTMAQQKRLEDLSAAIDQLETEISRLEEFLADPELYEKSPVKFQKAIDGVAERRQKLEAAEAEWLELAEIAEN